MTKLELATERARLFPTTYKALSKEAKARRTSIAFIIEEMRLRDAANK